MSIRFSELFGDSRNAQRGRYSPVRRVVGIGVCFLVAGAIVAYLADDSATVREAAQRATAELAELQPSGQDDHYALKAVKNSAGIEDPKLELVADSDFEESTSVIGIVVGDEPLCIRYRRDGR